MHAPIPTQTFDFDVEDVEFLRHGESPLLARLFVPRGKGPFRSVIELHGGAWCSFDRTRGKSVHEALARSGVSVVAIDFRQAEEGRYPLSVADINYGVRWMEGSPELELYGVAEVDLSNSSPATARTVPLTEAQSEEVRWLFCLSVPNLSEAVPGDVREFLGSLVA